MKMAEIKDKKDEVPPGMAQYMEIKAAYQDYLLFYRMGDFYELFFDDALKASKALDIVLTKRGQYKGADVPMCGVPFHAYEGYMARLIKQGFKVAICEQTEDPAEARKRGSKSVVKREVIRLVTPGTITEDTLLDSRKNNYLLAISKVNGAFGLAWVDLSTGEFHTQELSVNSANEATELYGVLTRLLPEEILLADSLLENPDLFQLFNEYREKLSVLPQARFNSENAKKQILEFFAVQTLDAFGSFSKAEIMSAGIVLDYLQTTQKIQLPRLNRPVKVLSNRYMEIDAATRHNLDLLEGPKGTTLISVMDRTVSGGGARMLSARLAAPLLNAAEINERLDVVEFFYKHHDLRQSIREVLRRCADIERSVARLGVGRGGPRDLKAVAQTLAVLPKIKVMLETYKRIEVADEAPKALQNIVKRLGNHDNLVDVLFRALRSEEDSQLPLLARDGGFIQRGYSAEFDAVCDMRDKGARYMDELEAKYAAQTQIDHLKVKYNNVIGYYIEVPAKSATKLLDNPEFIHRQSMLNSTRFVTVELTELENEIRGASEKALAIELGLYNDLVMHIIISADGILKSAAALAELDVAAALADLALERGYCRPVVDESLAFEVLDGRHPMVEAALKRDHNGDFVGNDCVLNVEDNRLWLLTGPNMAGKSTLLRQNALIASMAQTGAFVPAKSVHIGVVNKVFSRVGASDDLARGRSTFMVEMVETAAILNRADKRSFVILDEIGRGTATFDGLSIAWAVAEYLHDVNKCRALFATHYHEMANLAERLSAMTLHCMKIKEFNNQVIFLHEVVSGAADRSYGIHVANLAGLPQKVIKRAEQVLKKLEKENQQSNALGWHDELPLFNFVQPAEPVQKSAAEEALKVLNPDDLTAREALQKLYELKELVKEN